MRRVIAGLLILAACGGTETGTEPGDALRAELMIRHPNADEERIAELVGIVEDTCDTMLTREGLVALASFADTNRSLYEAACPDTFAEALEQIDGL